MLTHIACPVLSVLLCSACEQAVADLRAQGKSEKEIEKFSTLFSEVRQQIDSKQLRPFIRTQYMRTAFQVGTSLSMCAACNRSMCTASRRNQNVYVTWPRWYTVSGHVQTSPLPAACSLCWSNTF